MCQRKLTRRRFPASQDAVEMSAEAQMRPENAVCVGLVVNILHTNARSRQIQFLSCFCAAREEVDMQTEVPQEHLRFEIQPVDRRRIWGDVSVVDLSYALRNTPDGHSRRHAVSAEGTCHVVRQEVQRESTSVECVLTLQLHAIVAALRRLPNAHNAVDFDLGARAVEDVALHTAICHMKHHGKPVLIYTLQSHCPTRQVCTHTPSHALVNIHMTSDCKCLSFANNYV